jgi:hypothetical protein
MRAKKETTLKPALNDTNASTAISQRIRVKANGIIYKKHKNIDTQREMIAAMENHEFDKAFSNFTDDAAFGTANYGPGSITTTAGAKEYRIKFHTEYFDVLKMNMERSSVYIENENGKGGDVLSWYVFQLVRQSDKKEIEMPVHMIDSFNEEGKIIAEFAYYSNSLIYPLKMTS